MELKLEILVSARSVSVGECLSRCMSGMMRLIYGVDWRNGSGTPKAFLSKPRDSGTMNLTCGADCVIGSGTPKAFLSKPRDSGTMNLTCGADCVIGSGTPK